MNFTFGRFNIPTPGHIRLVRQMAAGNEQVTVCFSNAAGCLPLRDRQTAFQELLIELAPEIAHLVHFDNASNMYQSIQRTVSFEATSVFYCGADRRRDAEGIGRRLGGNIEIEIIERPVGAVSSTMIRELIDAGDNLAVESVYQGCSENTLALIYSLRQLEITR